MKNRFMGWYIRKLRKDVGFKTRQRVRERGLDLDRGMNRTYAEVMAAGFIYRREEVST